MYGEIQATTGSIYVEWKGNRSCGVLQNVLGENQQAGRGGSKKEEERVRIQEKWINTLGSIVMHII